VVHVDPQTSRRTSGSSGMSAVCVCVCVCFLRP
jgi:hypothetical protein